MYHESITNFVLRLVRTQFGDVARGGQRRLFRRHVAEIATRDEVDGRWHKRRCRRWLDGRAAAIDSLERASIGDRSIRDDLDVELERSVAGRANRDRMRADVEPDLSVHIVDGADEVAVYEQLRSCAGDAQVQPQPPSRGKGRRRWRCWRIDGWVVVERRHPWHR